MKQTVRPNDKKFILYGAGSLASIYPKIAVPKVLPEGEAKEFRPHAFVRFWEP
jgi:hypothetical protein